jgi:hypothetical protein
MGFLRSEFNPLVDCCLTELLSGANAPRIPTEGPFGYEGNLDRKLLTARGSSSGGGSGRRGRAGTPCGGGGKPLDQLSLAYRRIS